jgi:hypothetical protein
LLVWPTGGTPMSEVWSCSPRSGSGGGAGLADPDSGVPDRGRTSMPRVGMVRRCGGSFGWLWQGPGHSTPASGAVSTAGVHRTSTAAGARLGTAAPDLGHGCATRRPNEQHWRDPRRRHPWEPRKLSRRLSLAAAR